MIKFYTGTMKSGKSFELIKDIGKVGENALIIKPILDTRDGDYVVSRATDVTYYAELIDEEDMVDVLELFKALHKCEHLFIDEVQFFSKEFVALLLCHCEFLGIPVTASGLMFDFKRDVFPASQYLYRAADDVRTLHGDCDNCGRVSAQFDVRLNALGVLQTSGNSVGIEGEFKYLTVCKQCRTHLGRNSQ